MRKTPSRAFLCALCAILASDYAEGGGVMNVATIGSAWTGGGGYTAKDYVQDGLVAMFDGESSSIANGLSSLDGNYTFGSSGGFSRYDKKSVLSTSGKKYLTSASTEMSDAFLNKKLSVEMVVGKDGIPSSEVDPLVISDRIVARFNSVGMLSIRFYTSNQASKTVAWSSAYQDDNGIYWMWLSLFVNDDLSYSAKILAKAGILTQTGTTGYYGSSFTAYTVGPTIIRNMRFYNQSLTDEQRMYNYAIDKARFGLT